MVSQTLSKGEDHNIHCINRSRRLHRFQPRREAAAGRHTVIGVDNFLTGSTVNIDNLLRSPNFKFIEHDVIYPLAIEGPVDWVMHFASLASPPKYLSYPIETMRVNSEGTMHLLYLAKEKQAAFFLASTSEIYGNPTVLPLPEDDPRRRKPDITISRTIMDWEPAISLHDALARTIHYYQGQYIH
ncbi:GDP-mannose 4,6-dehydratase [Paenibacillus sp. ClWae2A]|uniref:GDP-mannose 4,6-dehydratase n=1 Tax=Paenibacillus sp. ClWae2A TaxID=3057177 RepID=UPI0028F6A6A6|nr:GDP-mannose 4,6-dehydratase [Paenibacillus sp. ClWae2A]MDT9721927.1 GDP-mannose 4,6-dehydratase [Paenibacillus sp. ClWae2A]